LRGTRGYLQKPQHEAENIHRQKRLLKKSERKFFPCHKRKRKGLTVHVGSTRQQLWVDIAAETSGGQGYSMKGSVFLLWDSEPGIGASLE
jgi:hypothetical protein